MTDFPPIPREKSLLPVDWAQLVYCPHPILVAQGRRIFNVRAGEPLAGLLRPIGPLDKLLQAFRISLSGVVIESADDLKRRVQPGDIIGLQALLLISPQGNAASAVDAFIGYFIGMANIFWGAFKLQLTHIARNTTLVVAPHIAMSITYSSRVNIV